MVPLLLSSLCLPKYQSESGANINSSVSLPVCVCVCGCFGQDGEGLEMSPWWLVCVESCITVGIFILHINTQQRFTQSVPRASLVDFTGARSLFSPLHWGSEPL